MSALPSDDALKSFRSTLDGAALAPADPGWDQARAPWNLVTDQVPGLVVEAASAADVAATVALAKASGMRIAPQGTGHGAARMPDLTDAILLRTGRLDEVDVDAAARSARVGSGVRWKQVVGEAAPHGLAALHGSSGTVGVAGYVLGGGLGWLARTEGFTCNHVNSFEVVTADGEIREASAASEPELFWALRGGAVAPAVVTAIEVELVELETAYAGALMWPIERAAEVAHGWLEWTKTIPDEMTTVLKLLRLPPLPAIPEPLRGRSLVAVTLAFRGGETEGAELVAPLRAIADPYLDMVAAVPAPALADIAGDPQDPTPGRGDGFMLSDVDDAAIDAYVELAGPDADVPLIHLELRHLGGALDRGSPDHGALDVAAGRFLLYGIGAAMSPELDGAITGTLAAIRERMEPWRAPCALFNFAELLPGYEGCFPAETAARLAAAKEAYDPEGMLTGVYS
jgi:FAD/FMN-containing dehydrogenase